MIAKVHSTPPLDPTIEAVALAYNFDIKFDDEFEKWIIFGVTQRKGADCFYWSSDETNEEFFRELKRFFMDQGCNN